MARFYSFLILIFLPFSLCAEESIIGDYYDYGQFLELSGRIESTVLTYRTYTDNNWLMEENSQHVWAIVPGNESSLKTWDWGILKLVSPDLFTSINTGYAHGMNDYGLWQGRGLNVRLTGGIKLDTQYLDITLAPEIWGSQNLPFAFTPSAAAIESEFGYFTNNIDLVQRYGDAFYYELDWGQSEIRFDWGAFTLGLSTQNIITGPAQVSPLIMSANAGGIPHIDTGLRPVTTSWGEVELRFLWGISSESDFFDSDSSNDETFISMMALGYSPSFLPGLTLGFNRVIQSPMAYLDWVTALTILDPTLRGLGAYFDIGASYGYDNMDQKASLTAEWEFPEVGFEVYGEFFREDYTNLRELWLLPEHTAGTVLGVQQAIPLSDNRGLLLRLETANMAQSRDYELYIGVNPAGYYTHHINEHGYTQNGQVIGTGIGPGGELQYIGLTYFDDWGKLTLMGQRIRNNIDYVYDEAYNGAVDGTFDPATESLRDIIDTEITVGGSGLVFLGDWDLYGTIAFCYNLNKNYIGFNDQINWYANCGVRYRPKN